MKLEIKVPVMGESVSEAIVSSFLVESGSKVESGQEVLELETDKVNQVLYAPGDGVITFTVQMDSVVKVGEMIGFVDSEGKASTQTKTPKEEVKAPEASKSATAKGDARQGGDAFLEALSKKEVTSASLAAAPAPVEKKSTYPEGTVTRKRMSGLRKTIAARLVEVKNKTAMLTTFTEVDLSVVMGIRAKEQEEFQKRYGVKLGFMSFFIKAAVAALIEFPQVNSFLEADEIIECHTYDIGVAVSTEKGLFVPVIKGCNEKAFGEIENELGTYAKKAREGTISIEDLKGGSFTITNGGVFGSLFSTPILNPPQSAILGMHSIVKRPVVVEDQIVIRPMMYLALSYDHRIIDGKDAVRFLAHIKASLEDPARLLLDL